jgi:hypothetical protein
MQTLHETTPPRKPAITYYGWLHDTHGIFLQVDGTVSFRDSTTETWQDVDLETLTRWAVLNGRVDLADTQALMDGDKVYVTSRTLQKRAA